MTYAVLSNVAHPDYNTVSIPFPIPRDIYDRAAEALEALEIGDPLQRDCHLTEIKTDYPILKRLEKTAINLDELDYLTKCLDSCTSWELAQYQGMAVKLGIFDMTDLINLTQCFDQF